mmetsp:Transcript_31488/g.66244  ORF Transcript_31488/g.66244 Transcript_31488/m.66244 type:complete len:211 (+) Transcript_31488:293-925(+)|eukprot:CAMPEP_0172299020 /NCGR_PEP_ID=MMETSP1058-20130122/1406_1 /TAXON_ID=83371 /ORGANISM="Detonula confervacea, Strain CCMP 353" /LENGTH=210 /DNA_ID=CAMNT_0013008323 /DNA_START=153 /DNA_END=785 /DNA_ORIENTATION=+
MNNKVKKAPAEGPIVKLAVYDASGSRVDIPSEVHQGDSIVWIDLSDSSPSLSFNIRMDPETTEGLSDIQYVVETAPFEDLKVASTPSGSAAPAHGVPSHHSQPSPTPMIPTVSSSTPVSVAESSFVKASGGGGILCNGKRGHARGKNGSVKYELVIKVPSNQKDDSDASILAEIVAGYSEYHGPVTLTPRVLFKGKDNQYEPHTVGQGEL